MNNYNKTRKKLLCGILSSLLSINTVSIARYDAENTGILRNRIIKRRDQQEVQLLVDEIGVDDIPQAHSKIRGLQKLLADLDAENVYHALANIDDVRTEYRITLDNHDADMQKIFNTLEVKTFDKAIEKIEKIQNSYHQIVQIAKNIDETNPSN